MTEPDLSVRGRRLAESPPLAEYLREHFARSKSQDYVPLCVAENKLVSELLAERLGRARSVPPRTLGYDAMTGSREFRGELATFMAERFLGRRFSPEQLAVLAGAGSVLEIVFHALADPGDGVLVPTPSYAGFWPDLETRDELVIVPVHTRASEGFRLSRELLDAALAGAGRRVRALLFTSPDNPLGRVYSAGELEQVMRWCEARRVHLVMDEIYALSVFGERPFVSAASLRPSLGEHVHVVWAFSKDFGMSGLRVGVLVSENRALLDAVDGLAYWACASGIAQLVLGEMIADQAWVDTYLASMRARLGQAQKRTAEALDQAGVPYLPSEAGFFMLVDFRHHLKEPTWAAEAALWRRLLETTNVNLTPGSACRVGEPGFMRLCFAAVPTDRVVAAVQRLGEALCA